MTDQNIQVVFRVRSGQNEHGWNLIKHMSLMCGIDENFILPNWAEILFISAQKKKVDNGKYFIEITNPSRRDIAYAETLMDFNDMEFIKNNLKPNMGLI